jgi:Flp pilus assembly secretin CpaC
MTAVFAYRRRRPFHALVLPMAVLGAAALYGALAPARAAEAITVVLDQATIAKLPERVATIVIGNPLIADVTVQAGGLMVVTGKGYGTTNLIALDRAGTVLTERSIQVLSPQDKVVFVYRGVNRESYSCAPQCERRITLGDGPEFFDQTLLQSSNRTARAQGGGTGAPAR